MLFKGTFNWYCEVHVLYSHAKNESRAFNNFITQLTKILKVSRRRVYPYFADKNDYKYSIKGVITNDRNL